MYSQWIKMYTSKEYKALADWARRLAEGSSPKELARKEEAYLTSLRYEYMF